MLTKNAKIAEVQRGCVFAENFNNAIDIAKNGGTITGALEFGNKGGAYFDGTNDYIAYPNSPASFGSGLFSAVVEFTPDFAANDGVAHTFFANAAATTNLNKSAANALVLRSGADQAAVAYATWSPYWKAGQKNTLVVSSGISGYGYYIYLNGTLVGSGPGNYGALVANSALYIGAYGAGATSKFKGIIHSLKIFRHTSSSQFLTAREALDYYTGQTFTYDKRATVILPMTADCHDATNKRTLDISGNGNHFTFGDGSTATTFPTKLAKRGYYLDGGDYFKSAIGLVSALTNYTVVILTSGQLQQTYYPLSIGNAADSTSALDLQYAAVVNYRLLGSTSVNLTNVNFTSGVNAIACSYNASTTKWSVVQNGKYILETGVYVLSSDKNGYVYLGTRQDKGAGKMSGNYLHFAIYPFAMTPLQMIDATLKLQKTLNLT